MNLDVWMGSLGTEVIWLAIGAGFAMVLASLHATLALAGRPVLPLRLVAGAGLGVALAAALARLSLLADDARLGAVTAAVVGLVGPLLVGPAVAVTSAACAFLGARGAPRRWGWAAAAGVPVLVAAGAVAWGGYAVGDPLYASARAAAYVGLAGMVALSVLGRGDGAATGGAAMAPLAVALGEASQRGLVSLLIVLQADTVSADRWPLAVSRMLDHVQPEWIASWGAFGAAGVAAAVGAAADRRGQAFAAAALALGLGAALLLGADARQVLAAVGAP